MSESQRIDPEVIETAALALHDCAVAKFGADPVSGRNARVWRAYAEAAIRAADEARGLKEERCGGPFKMFGTEIEIKPLSSRLVSDWRPVERASIDAPELVA